MLGLLAAGVAGSSLLPHLAAATSGPGAEDSRLDRFGLQLYTVRNALRTDIEGTLAAIAAIGISELEFAGYYDRDAAWWRALLTRHGLTAPSTHEALPDNDEGFEAIFDRANSMGHRLVLVPSSGAQYRGSVDNWKRLADRLNVGATRAKSAGLLFGYHNHDYEFTPVGDTTGYDVITSQTDTSLMKLELDVYWAVKAGQDPLAILGKWPGRVIACHVKDAGPAPGRQMVDVGAGTIDFRTILQKGRASGLAHYFIEHDNPIDPMASVRASAAAMKQY